MNEQAKPGVIVYEFGEFTLLGWKRRRITLARPITNFRIFPAPFVYCIHRKIVEGGNTVFRKSIGFLSLLVAAAMVLSACTTTKKPVETPPTTPSNEPAKPAGPQVGGEIVFDVPDDPDTFAVYWLNSAYAAEVTDRVYGDGLVRIGYDYKPEPALAEAMPEISADGTTYTFKVRKGVKFHDGKELTAADVEFSYNILLNPDYQGPEKSTVAEIVSVKALDPYTIEIKLKQAFAPFVFGGASVNIVPKHIFEKVPVKDMASSELWKSPIGAGAYKFKEWKTGQYTLLERNPEYWENGKVGVNNGVVGPWVERVRIRVIPEENTAMAALEAGELSFRDSVEPSHVDRLRADFKDKLVGFDWNRMGYGYQTFNTTKFPTDSKEVRQALSYGLNRKVILEGVMENKASIPAGFIPPIHWTFDKTQTGYAYDPKKAEELIQKAGFKKNANGIYEKDGKPLKLQYVGTKGSSIIEGIALQSQKDWKAIGVDTEIILVDFNTLLDKHMKPGDFNVTFSGLGFSIDPHYSFNNSFHSSNIRLDDKGVNQGSNNARYKNPEVDKLIDEGKVTSDINKRLEIYQKAQKMIIDDAPANWIYVNVWTDFAKKDIQGVVNWDGYGINVIKHQNQWNMSSAK
jgi:peptide/nickel transport system substrate-binding protein